MAEQIGVKLVGQTTTKELFVNSISPQDIIPAVFPGGSAVTFLMGTALINSATNGQKAKYTNAAAVAKEAVDTGDGSTKTFDLGHANIITGSFKAYVAGVEWDCSISAGTGTGGVDQVVFATAPTNAAAITADYDYHATARGVTGACILMNDSATTTTGGNQTEDACRDGAIKTSMVLDANGAAVDAYFKAALPKVTFD